MRRVLTLALAAGLAASPAFAQTAPVIEQAWARATAANAQTAAAYLTLHGTGADALTGVSTPAAASAALHRSQTVDGVMEMRPVGTLPLQPGQEVKLAPGGLHIMLMGLTQPLKPGDHFPLTLNFTHAGAVTTTVTVGSAGAAGPPMAMP